MFGQASNPSTRRPTPNPNTQRCACATFCHPSPPQSSSTSSPPCTSRTPPLPPQAAAAGHHQVRRTGARAPRLRGGPRFFSPRRCPGQDEVVAGSHGGLVRRPQERPRLPVPAVVVVVLRQRRQDEVGRLQGQGRLRWAVHGVVQGEEAGREEVCSHFRPAEQVHNVAPGRGQGSRAGTCARGRAARTRTTEGARR